jgi:hypothetical protein
VARRFDPASLFEHRTMRGAPRAYPSERALNAAVAARTKALSIGHERLRDVGTWLPAMMRFAERGDLAVVISSRASPKSLQLMQVCMLPLEETWRLQAIAAFDATRFFDGSVFAKDEQQSALFGYTPEQRAEWRAYQRDLAPSKPGITMYALIDAARRRSVESVGNRCFGPLDDDLPIFWHPWRPNVKRTAFARIPRGLTLARFTLHNGILNALFGYDGAAREPQLDRTVITRRRMRAVTKALRSNVQFLTRMGWR